MQFIKCQTDCNATPKNDRDPAALLQGHERQNREIDHHGMSQLSPGAVYDGSLTVPVASEAVRAIWGKVDGDVVAEDQVRDHLAGVRAEREARRPMTGGDEEAFVSGYPAEYGQPVR
jgi:hypothetical protein